MTTLHRTGVLRGFWPYYTDLARMKTPARLHDDMLCLVKVESMHK